MANILNLYKKEEDKETGIINFIPVDAAKDTICGRTIEEIIVILNCLDIEKEYQMKMTLENLKSFEEFLVQEREEIINKMLKGMFEKNE